jgi:hypothetical protein
MSRLSQDRTTGTGAAAYLGSCGGGLGVTDTGEDGSSNTHTVDNTGGRDNYVPSSSTVPSCWTRPSSAMWSATAICVWIGNFNNAYTSHLAERHRAGRHGERRSISPH